MTITTLPRDISRLSDLEIMQQVKNRVGYEYPSVVIAGYLVPAVNTNRTELVVALIAVYFAITDDDAIFASLTPDETAIVTALADDIRCKSSVVNFPGTPVSELLINSGFLDAA